MQTRAAIREAVRAFYDDLPFNAASPRSAAARIARHDQLLAYPDLRAVLVADPRASVLDLGCGTGWFALTVAARYGRAPVAVDLSRAALELAEATAVEVGVAGRIEFVHADLFEFVAGRASRFGLVNCLGVLHHTGDFEAGLRAAAGLTSAGGHLHLGLYHSYGRAPFLSLFDRCETTEEAFSIYSRLWDGAHEPELLTSWFHDQVCHPHETQHTLAEVDAILADAGMELLSTSLSHFVRPVEKQRVFDDEPRQREISIQRNVAESRYFPGFFTALYRRVAG